MLLTPEELEGALESGEADSYMDPNLKHNDKQYAAFVAQLFEAGVVQVSEHVLLVNGISFVTRRTAS